MATSNPPGYTFDQVMDLWVNAGGSPQSAAMAAAVADASSGLNPNTTQSNNGITQRGLWQISSTLGPLSSTDPMTNARAAIQLSNNGTNFAKWCAAWSDNACGNQGGTYLGDGSNAIAALAQRGGAYNVIGGVGVTTALPQPLIDPATGQPASADYLSKQPLATPGNAPAYSTTGLGSVTGPPAPTTMNKTVVILLILGVAVIGAIIMIRRGNGSSGETLGE